MREIAQDRPPLWVSAAARVIQMMPAGRYRAMNWIASRPAPPFWTRTPAHLGSLMFRCDLRDVLMREVCMTGRYEPQETELVTRLLTRGGTFADVGANWGYFSLLASHLVGPGGLVVSVEADPRACATVRANVEANRLTQVRVFEAAASDAAGTLLFETYGRGNDDTSNFGVALAALDARAASNGALRIAARRLDDIFDEAGASRIDVLKMDIEGAERRAMIGLGRWLHEGRIDRIILELHPRHLVSQGSSAAEVLADMRRQGFAAWSIDHSPRAHRDAASGRVDARALLTPLDVSSPLEPWPHVLLVREGLEALPDMASLPVEGPRR